MPDGAEIKAQATGTDDATTVTKKETWRDWLPATWTLHNVAGPPLLTRSKILEHLHVQGVDVEERTVRFWTLIGLLPRPIRRGRGRGGRGGNVWYPDWMPAVIAELAELKANRATKGLGVDELRLRMQHAFRARALAHAAKVNRVTKDVVETTARVPNARDVPQDIADVLTSYCRAVVGSTYRGALRATLSVRDEEGHELSGHDITLFLPIHGTSDG